MENASKALMIAGAILIAMIVISLFYYAFGQIGSFMQATEEDSTQKEISAVNTSFEAYNKKVMYGVDIISVINKAIDNNKRYDVEYFNEPEDEEMLDYYINIVITYNAKNIEGAEDNNTVSYSLKNNYTKNPNTNTIKKKFLEPVSNKDDSIHNFKVAGFKCSKVLYNKKGETNNIDTIGRIKQMEFVEI